MADLCFALPSSATHKEAPLQNYQKNSKTPKTCYAKQGFPLVSGGFLENCASTSTKSCREGKAAADPASPQLPKVTAALQALPSCHLHITQLKTNTPSPLATAAPDTRTFTRMACEPLPLELEQAMFPGSGSELVFSCVLLHQGRAAGQTFCKEAPPSQSCLSLNCSTPKLIQIPYVKPQHGLNFIFLLHSPAAPQQSWEEGSAAPFCRFVLNTSFPSLKDLALLRVTEDPEGAAYGSASLLTLQALCCNTTWKFYPC